jgi:hypothetical protein
MGVSLLLFAGATKRVESKQPRIAVDIYLEALKARYAKWYCT